MRDRFGAWALAVLFVSVLAVGVNSIVYSDHVARMNNRQWCDVVSTLDDAYRAQPPSSLTGRRLAVEMHALRVRFGCP